MSDLLKKTTASEPSGDPLIYVMSDETVDRVGDVIVARGWILDNFLKNPIALFGHDHNFIIGHWSDVKVRGKQLIGRLNLLPKGISARLDEIRAAVEAGVLRAVSVGFAPDPDEMERNKTGGWRIGVAELLECSLVGVPANPNALQLAKQLKLSDKAQSLIFGRSAPLPVVKLRGAPRGSRTNSTTRVVSIGKPFKIKKIHARPKWQPGDPIRVKRTSVPVVRLDPEDCPWLNERKAPARVVRLTKEDIERGKRRAKHVVVRLGRR